MRNFLLLCATCLLWVAIFVPIVVVAQPCGAGEKICGSECIPRSSLCLNLDYPRFGPFDLNINQNIAELIYYAYYFIIGIAGLAAFVMLIWGGTQWLVSGAAPSQASEARDKVRNAIIGLLLVLASFLIVQIINPELTILRGPAFPEVDCSNLDNPNACNPLGQSISGVSYVCPNWKYANTNVLECTGDIPLFSENKPEACVRAPGPTDITDRSCVQNCQDNGGEYAWFDHEQYCCNLPTADVTCTTDKRATTITLEESTNPQPLTQSVMRSLFGVYGCDEDNCKGGPDWAWRRFADDTPDICGTPSTLSFPKGDRLCNQIGSLWIHGDLVAVLYEHKDYGGDRICFAGSPKPGRLIPNLNAMGWGDEASSIKVLKQGDPGLDSICPPGKFEQTLPP